MAHGKDEVEPGRRGAALDPERRRLAEARDGTAPWLRWGPYLSERQWGTVREDYSADGDAWAYFPHDHARSRAYRWGEDGLLGICDDRGLLCFAVALWNGADPFLKERLFGLSSTQGNHGEDVKEYYFHLDNTPTHSYMKALYKYPQQAFPYDQLVAENARRTRNDPEYELLDTGSFAEHRYFDVVVEYAKAGPEDILIRITATNRGPEPASLRVLPTLWFRNTWAWKQQSPRPELRTVASERAAASLVHVQHADFGDYWLACEGAPPLLVTENETNSAKLWGDRNNAAFVKDGISDAVVCETKGAVNPAGAGTKAAAHYSFAIGPGASETVLLRLSAQRHDRPFVGAAEVFTRRRKEADAFYRPLARGLGEEERQVQRQAFAGLLWTKQFYLYEIDDWLDGDPAGPPPPEERKHGRNAEWRHLNNADVISVPDKWEFPWYACWDLAFHCISLAHIDPEFAKQQLLLMVNGQYMHPNGQLPAYEWSLGDVNPPVHAWSALRVYEIDRRLRGADRAFLERVFHKLLLNFTWWVNRKDVEGRNVFQGGFLGLDNIGVFDRSGPLPTGGHLEQSDGTAWMAMYCLNMLAIAIELARENRVYEELATKFFEHFMYIAAAMNNIGGEGISLWDEEDDFFYDVLHLSSGESIPLKVRSLVGLIPLLAVETIEPDLLDTLPEFRGRLERFLEHYPELAQLTSHWHLPGAGERRLLALVRGHRMKRILSRMLDPAEFLSDCGIRSLSKYHEGHPYELRVDGARHTVRYEPGESAGSLFGGNSNWRGPVWFPLNYLLIEALRRFHQYYDDDFLVEFPTGSGRRLSLQGIADELSRRLCKLYLRGKDGRRPADGASSVLGHDPHWRDHALFYEYFHGDSGAGLGASHQTGWTGLLAALLAEQG